MEKITRKKKHVKNKRQPKKGKKNANTTDEETDAKHMINYNECRFFFWHLHSGTSSLWTTKTTTKKKMRIKQRKDHHFVRNHEAMIQTANNVSTHNSYKWEISWNALDLRFYVQFILSSSCFRYWCCISFIFHIYSPNNLKPQTIQVYKAICCGMVNAHLKKRKKKNSNGIMTKFSVDPLAHLRTFESLDLRHTHLTCNTRNENGLKNWQPVK